MGLSSILGLKSKHTNQAANIEIWMRCNPTITNTNPKLRNLTKIMTYFYHEKSVNLPQSLQRPSSSSQFKIMKKFIRTKVC